VEACFGYREDLARLTSALTYIAWSVFQWPTCAKAKQVRPYPHPWNYSQLQLNSQLLWEEESNRPRRSLMIVDFLLPDNLSGGGDLIRLAEALVEAADVIVAELEAAMVGDGALAGQPPDAASPGGLPAHV
jgi:hypothetical protein